MKENKIDDGKVKIEDVGFPVREPMLADGKVDAITGFSFSSCFNLMSKGIAKKDIKVMLMSDYGIVLYGNAIMVNPEFAKANPKVVEGLVRATVKGIIDTIKDPDSAIESVMKRNETADEKIELVRLGVSLNDNIAPPWAKANGVGGIDDKRMDQAIEQIAVTYEFKNAKPKGSDLFSSQYLPRMPSHRCQNETSRATPKDDAASIDSLRPRQPHTRWRRLTNPTPGTNTLRRTYKQSSSADIAAALIRPTPMPTAPQWPLWPRNPSPWLLSPGFGPWGFGPGPGPLLIFMLLLS